MSPETGTLQDKLLYPSIPIGFLEDVLQAPRYRGLNVDAVLQTSGLSPRRLALPAARISIEQYAKVIRELRSTTNDAFVGFLSSPVPLNAFSVFSYGVTGCRSLHQLVEQANAFYTLFSRDFRWYLAPDSGDMVLCVEVERVLPVDYRFIIQSLLLMTVRLFGWLLGEDVDIKSTGFSFAPKDTDQHLNYLFGPDIHYGCPENFVRINGRYSEVKLSCTREQIRQMLRSMQNLFLVSRNKRPLSREVRRRLLFNKAERWLEVEELARELRLTPHQLWRQLAREGTSFLDIRDEVKRDWALELIEDPAHTVEQVAGQLRYGDVSAFRKAFKKWTGLQPGRYRKVL